MLAQGKRSAALGRHHPNRTESRRDGAKLHECMIPCCVEPAFLFIFSETQKTRLQPLRFCFF